MQFDLNVLTRTERRVFALRTLFAESGYRPYKMRKFEEYDLYSRNKDFLLSDRVITFTDTNGSLKALKPDVTLSIVKNIRDVPGELQRLYYDENVYRVSEHTDTYKEIMQMGLECIGDAGNAAVTEVTDLAERSLALLAEEIPARGSAAADGTDISLPRHDYVLKVSDLDILTMLLDEIAENMTGSSAGMRSFRSEIMRLAGEKNIHGIREACAQAELSGRYTETLAALISLHGTPAEVLPQLEEICRGTAAEAEVGEFRSVLEPLPGSRRILIDFSITGDTNYYNGVALAGYIEGIPECVLVGGRYDKLMQRMKKKSRAIGFAIYLDSLKMLGRYR